MREHVVPEDVGAEYLGERWVRGFGSTAEVWVAARLRACGPADAGALVRRVGDGGPEVGQNAPDRGRPVDADDAADAGVEHDGVEFGHGAQELRGQRVHRLQRGQVQ